MSSLRAWTHRVRLSVSGANDLPSRAFLAWNRNLGAGVPPSFPPGVVVQVKALACELPHRLQLPLSRLSLSEIRREVLAQGLVAKISGATLWRWLSADALRPWRHRSWIFPRDPDFAAKAGRILDLYNRVWKGRPLNAREFVISADEKVVFKPVVASNLPWRLRRVVPPESNTNISVKGHGPIWLPGMCIEPRCSVAAKKKTGIVPVDRLIGEVMSREPYQSARRVFWIMDNCSAHRGQKAVDRLRAQWPNVVLVHTPVHASWLNQIEIYFSIVQRKVLTPNDFKSLNELEQRLLAFQRRYEETASPFQWTFTRKDLTTLLAKIENKRLASAA